MFLQSGSNSRNIYITAEDGTTNTFTQTFSLQNINCHLTACNISLGLLKFCLIQNQILYYPVLKQHWILLQGYNCYLGSYRKRSFFFFFFLPFCVVFTMYLSVENSYILLQEPTILLFDRKQTIFMKNRMQKYNTQISIMHSTQSWSQVIA